MHCFSLQPFAPHPACTYTSILISFPARASRYTELRSFCFELTRPPHAPDARCAGGMILLVKYACPTSLDSKAPPSVCTARLHRPSIAVNDLGLGVPLPERHLYSKTS